LPVDLSSIQERVFFIAGGYKYAMSGEGICFMHCPPGYGDRPVNTGWYAAFDHLEQGVGDKVTYATDGSRFAGATFDPTGIYRMNAVLDWLASMGVDPGSIHRHVVEMQTRFLDHLTRMPGSLLPARSTPRGNFLTFRSDRAETYYRVLHEQNVVTDHRGDRLRFGFGIYHNEHDVDRLIEVVDSLEVS
jgi:kynureninase